MNICIAATGLQREQLLTKGIADSAGITWANTTEELLQIDAEAYIDCTFCMDKLPRTDKPCLVHSPVHTLNAMQAKGKWARFCAWNTFLERPLWEIAVTESEDDTWVINLMNSLSWKFCLVKDEPGLISPRIVAGIVQEANYTWQAGVSTKEEIDLAMKLGTNYPYGPFEWADKIGNNNIDDLLIKLNS